MIAIGSFDPGLSFIDSFKSNFMSMVAVHLFMLLKAEPFANVLPKQSPPTDPMGERFRLNSDVVSAY